MPRKRTGIRRGPKGPSGSRADPSEGQIRLRQDAIAYVLGALNPGLTAGGVAAFANRLANGETIYSVGDGEDGADTQLIFSVRHPDRVAHSLARSRDAYTARRLSPRTNRAYVGGQGQWVLESGSAILGLWSVPVPLAINPFAARLRALGNWPEAVIKGLATLAPAGT